MNLNVRGYFLLSQHIANKSMIPNRSGKIINIASIQGWSTHITTEEYHNKVNTYSIDFRIGWKSSWAQYNCLQYLKRGRHQLHTVVSGRVGKIWHQCEQVLRYQIFSNTIFKSQHAQHLSWFFLDKNDSWFSQKYGWRRKNGSWYPYATSWWKR